MSKKATNRFKTRRGPQPPAKKPLVFRRSRANSYRRSRRTGEPRRLWRRAILLTLGTVALAGLSLGLILLYHQLLTAAPFCIKENKNIEIEGLKRLTPEVVLQLTGLGPATNLLALKPSQVERALLAHPWISKAEITRKWPCRVHLQIQERDPMALVQLGDIYYVDRQGGLFKPMSPEDPHNFPVITGLKEEHFRPVAGALPEVLAQTFQLLDLLKTTAPPLNLENISEVHVDLERGFTLYANGLATALELGLTEHGDKLKKFAQVWPALAKTGYLSRAGRINLDYPQRVLLTLKGMEESQ